MYAVSDLYVAGSSASSNTWIGIVAGGNGNITNSVASYNAYTGILISGRLVTGCVLATNGATGQFLRGGVGISGGSNSGTTITNNAISGTFGFGIFVIGSGSPTAGYGSNTFVGNRCDVSANSGFRALKNNVTALGIF